VAKVRHLVTNLIDQRVSIVQRTLISTALVWLSVQLICALFLIVVLGYSFIIAHRLFQVSDLPRCEFDDFSIRRD
jgi:hypothetical protein